MEREECKAVKAIPDTRYATGTRNRAILEVMHRGGLRVSEVCNLKRRDVIWEEGLLQIHQAKGRKDRPVRVDAQAMQWLQKWDGRRAGIRGRGEYFFCSIKGRNRGERMTPRSIQRMLDTMVRRAVRRGLLDPERAKMITPHKFRHAHATELVEEHAPLTEVQAQLGHANMSTTSRYLHARAAGLKDFMAAREPDLPLPK